jgi:hypothetical protein
MRLLFRIAKLEERHGGCGWCGMKMVWCPDELTVVNGVAKPICPECGRDHTGYAKVVLRELWESI